MKRSRIQENTYTSLLMTLLFAGLTISAEGADIQGGINDARRGNAVVKRDPFWPVGYMPKQSVRTVSVKSTKARPLNSWNEAMKNVVINGVSSRTDNEYFAIINGNVKRVGDTVSVRLGASVYTWAVDAIESQGSVKLRRISVR